MKGPWAAPPPEAPPTMDGPPPIINRKNKPPIRKWRVIIYSPTTNSMLLIEYTQSCIKGTMYRGCMYTQYVHVHVHVHGRVHVYKWVLSSSHKFKSMSCPHWCSWSTSPSLRWRPTTSATSGRSHATIPPTSRPTASRSTSSTLWQRRRRPVWNSELWWSWRG